MDESKMKIAITEARNSAKLNNSEPFGAVVMRGDEVVGIAHNETIERQDSMAHSVMLALATAERKLETHDLSGCDVWTVHEPCPMCLGACICCGVSHVYYGIPNKKLREVGIDVARIGMLFDNKEFIRRFMTQDSILDCLSVYEDYLRKRESDNEQ